MQDDRTVEKIVREVVAALLEKGLIKGAEPESFDRLRTLNKVEARSESMDDSPESQREQAKPAAVRVTTGTAGKVFSAEPGAWKPLPKPPWISVEEGPVAGKAPCGCCGSLVRMSREDLRLIGADRLGVCHPLTVLEGSEGKTGSLTGGSIARIIDHTLLKPNATREEIITLCREAKQYCFASVCVNPCYVSLASTELLGSGVKVCTVVGFPLGSTTPAVKALEARDAIAGGADEIDMVINVGALKSGDFQTVLDDIRAVRAATPDRLLKVIIETSLLTREEKVKACEMAREAGADFVKTSTGFSSGGATVEDVRIMRQAVGPGMGIKASGGIRDFESAKKLVGAGATRIGASASVAIALEGPAGSEKY